jgi:hypothetical protein
VTNAPPHPKKIKDDLFLRGNKIHLLKEIFWETTTYFTNESFKI